MISLPVMTYARVHFLQAQRYPFSPVSDALMLCSFSEDDTCGLVDTPSGDFQWELHRGETPSRDTGPLGDVSPNGDGKQRY